MIDISHRALGAALLATAGLALAVPALLVAQSSDDERESYSYVRTLEGGAVLSSDSRESSVDAELHEPLLQGDLVTVESGARVELVLADRSLLRVAGGSSVRLTRVAFSADRDDRTTRLDLDGGEILLTVGDDALGDELPEIRTPLATVYVHEPGIYRVEVDGNSLELVVREGYAELLTDRGSTVVRGGESAWTTGDRSQRVEVAAAGPEDALELWGEDLERDVQAASSRELRVEPELAYAAAPLANYGSWVNVDTSWYWRPRVSVGWRPYWDGRWAWTPSGLTWVSYEPWGWVPYHYGTWTFLPHYGWAWRPGYVYSPAWVYWNIGPTWTGWCPTGYYTDYYRPYGHHDFRFGIYGWSGGSWGFYADWNFSLTVRVFDRSPDRWRHSGFHLARTEGGDLDRGVLTTDTAALPRERWARPRELVDTLAQRGRRDLHGQRDLPDVSQFVARRRELPPDVRAAVIGNGRGRSLDRATRPGRGSANVDGLARTGERPSRSRDGARREPASAEVRGRSGRDTAALPSVGTPRGGERAGAGVERRAAPPSATVDRQGWRSREAGAPVAVPRGEAAPRAARGAAPARPEPVQRVIGGLRREPGTAGAEPRGGSRADSSPPRQREQPGATLRRERPQPGTRQGFAAPSGGRSAATRPSQPSSPRAVAPPTRTAPAAPKAAGKPTSPPRRATAAQAKPSPSAKSDEKTSSPPPPRRSPRSDATFVRESGRTRATAPLARQRTSAPSTSPRVAVQRSRPSAPRATAPVARQRPSAPSTGPRVAVQRSRPSAPRATAPPARSTPAAPRAAARRTSPPQRATASQAKPGGGSRSGVKTATPPSRESTKKSAARSQRSAGRGGGN